MGSEMCIRDRSRPVPIIMVAIIDMTALLENPSNSIADGRIGSTPGIALEKPSATSTTKAATSNRSTSVTSSTTVNNSRPRATTISGVSAMLKIQTRSWGKRGKASPAPRQIYNCGSTSETNKSEAIKNS